MTIYHQEMKWRMNEIIVFMTTSNEDEAARIGRALVEARLAGCVNIIRNIRSIYRWQGKLEDEKEVLMVAKTRQEFFGALAAKVKELHSYKVPEVIAIPIVEGSTDYLQWLKEVTGSAA
jgi:periplasmic divalent cation tolerance protein